MTRVILFCLLGLPVSVLACETGVLQVDAGQGEVGFSVEQDGVPFSGKFRDFGGELCRSDGGLASIDVWLDPASVDSGLPEVDELLLTPAFFDVESHPRVHFRSSNIDRQGMLLVARGLLEINGIEQERAIEFRLGQQDDGSWLARGRFSLQRLRFELGTGEWGNTEYLANEVTVSFEASLRARE